MAGAFAAIPVALAMGWPWFCCWRFRVGCGSSSDIVPTCIPTEACPSRCWLHSARWLTRDCRLPRTAVAATSLLFPTIWVVISIGFFWFLLRATSLTMQRLRIHAISAGRIGTGTLMVLGERLLAALVVILAILATLGIVGST